MPNARFGTAVTSGGPSTFFLDEKPKITPDFRDLLVHYSHIPASSVETHVQDIRNKAWNDVAKYPCIGLYLFAETAIKEHFRYSEVLNALKQSSEAEPKLLLDLGTCFGQDLRRLAYDGAPSNLLHGHDLKMEFIDLGYELFNDGSTFAAKFTEGDFFSGGVLSSCNGSFDYIHAASFFHLFNWDEQLESFSRAVKLLKAKPGSMIFGKQVGERDARGVPHTASRSGEMFCHNEESFRKLINGVEKASGIALDAELACFRHESWAEDSKSLIVAFAVTVR